MHLAKLLLLQFTILLAATGCGYVMAGKWDDHPGNWKRVFHHAKPDDVTVIHSQYWRAPHWTYECEYFFKVASNAKLRKELFDKNKLRKINDVEAAAALGNIFGTAPPWFAPMKITEYDAWVYAEDPKSHFILLIEKKTGNIFITDYQV
jgi:hypothetical protein